jgi:hypothetical protein
MTGASLVFEIVICLIRINAELALTNGQFLKPRAY